MGKRPKRSKKGRAKQEKSRKCCLLSNLQQRPLIEHGSEHMMNGLTEPRVITSLKKKEKEGETVLRWF